jgi:ornithine--oxo-acid transaminase
MFAFQHEDARPDVLILGKALSGGVYPVSCVCADHEVMDVFTPGSHGSTYGGNPLAAAAALAALDVIEDEGLCERSRELGEHALGRLRAELTMDRVREVRGRGLMIAVEYHERVAAAVARALADAGILVKDAHGDIVRLLPPLVIAREDLDAALDAAIPILSAAGGERS